MSVRNLEDRVHLPLFSVQTQAKRQLHWMCASLRRYTTLRVREVPQTFAFLNGPHVFRYEHDAFMNDHHTFPFDPDTIHYDSGTVIYDPLAF